MTLLVLGIGVPEIPAAAAQSQLTSALLALWPKFLSYGISFIVTGIYWSAHHNQFHFIRRADRTYIWINIIFLMLVSLIPFSAALLGHYSSVRAAIDVYGLNLILVGASLYLHWWYATSRRRLTDPELDDRFVRAVKLRILAGPVAYALSIALSFVSTPASLAVYVLVPILYISPGRVDRMRDERARQ